MPKDCACTLELRDGLLKFCRCFLRLAERIRNIADECDGVEVNSITLLQQTYRIGG